MIQLDLSRTQMLAEIEAPQDDQEVAALEPGDPDFLVRDPARLVVRAHHRDEFYPELELVLRRRFRRVAREHMEQDFLSPLKDALGNAFRRGNREDRAKWLTLEITATSRGAVLAVSDEGSGFDVAEVVRQFRNKERYFQRGGHGTARFAATPSLVGYADGGRTWLLRFLADPEPGTPLAPAADAALDPAADAAFLRAFLATRVFGERGVALDSCRVYALAGGERGTKEFGYVLRVRSPQGATKPLVLTGRVLPADAARADVTMAGRLREAGVGTTRGLHIPRPLGANHDPSLSLFQLDPSTTLREHAKRAKRLSASTLPVALAAAGLARLHGSAVRCEAVESLEEITVRHRGAGRRVEAKLAGHPDQPRARACFDLLLARAAALQPCAPVPIHGALEWDCIVGTGERWHLYRFDRIRRSHPGLDVGAFLADMLRLHVLRPEGDPRLHAAGRAVFLGSYFVGSRPAWSRDLGWFVAGALLERLERMFRRDEGSWAPKVGPLLGQVERALQGK